MSFQNLIKSSRQPILSVIIVNWNSLDCLKNCLDALKKDDYFKNFWVYVIDNNSSDDSQRVLQKNYSSWVHLIFNNENLGFSKANNQVLKKVKTKYSLLLNPDTIVQKDAIKNMVLFLEENSQAGACGALLLNPNLTIQKNGFYIKLPSVLQVLFFYTHWKKYSQRSKLLNDYFWEKDLSESQSTMVEQIPGACFLGRTEIFKKIHYLDEDYFLWFEDVELSWQFKKLGYKLFVVPSAKIIHIGGVSFGKWHQELKKEVRFFSSLFIYSSKHFNFLERFLVRIIIYLSYLFLIVSREIKQFYAPTSNRGDFVKHKMEVLKCLLVS